MKVQFDLRPSGLVERERKQKAFNVTRLITILLMALFFISSALCAWNLFLTRLRLQEEVAMKESSVAALTSEKAALETQVAELKDRQKVFADTLNIMQEDLPSIEVFRALESTMDYGMRLSSIRFVTGSQNMVDVTGSAVSDMQLVAFSQRLEELDPQIFDSVSIPNTAFDSRSETVSFTLRVAVKAIGDIKYDEQQVTNLGDGFPEAGAFGLDETEGAPR